MKIFYNRQLIYEGESTITVLYDLFKFIDIDLQIKIRLYRITKSAEGVRVIINNYNNEFLITEVDANIEVAYSAYSNYQRGIIGLN